ncbi:MAG: putative transposase [Desulforhopalus sp.]|jgi:putative transposase
MTKYHTRTLKLKLKVVSSSAEEKTEIWQRLYSIQNDAWRAANWIASGQFMNDQLVRRVYARKQIDPKDKEAVNKVEDDFKQFFGTKRQATTEKDVKAKFPNLPPCITNPLNQVVVSSYNKEKSDLLMGNRSLRTYRKTMPFTITKASLKLHQTEDGHLIDWTLGRKDSIKFSIYYGRDKANFRLVVKRILEGENDYSASQIQINSRDIFLLLVIKEPDKDIVLNPELTVGVDLGIAVPAYVALSTGGPQRMAIGDAADFIKVRTQMQSRRRRLQRNLVSVKGGKGRSKKTKTLDNLSKKERNFAHQYNHMISKRVIDFALRYSAGNINIELLEGFSKDEPNGFVLRNWSYFELQTMLADKAKRVGIEIKKIDPYHTSQTCSACGHYEEGQRDGRNFKCKNPECCNNMHSDHNAAVNIAKSDKFIKKREQSEYYKRSKENKKLTAGLTAEG